jgi:hypothetical protein
MRVVIVYHRGCPDGFGAAWWLRLNLLREHRNIDIELVPANWGDDPPLDRMMGADVWLVDYCYEGLALEAVAGQAATLTVMDHHQTSLRYARDSGLPFYESLWDYTSRYDSNDLGRIEIVIDQTKSGAGLVARVVEHVFGWAPPLFMWNLEDRDLWKFDDPWTRNIFAAVTARPYTTEAWDAMDRMDHMELNEQGSGINLYRDQLIESVAASVFWITVGGDGTGRWVPCASSPYFIGSDVAGLLAERHNGIGAYVILHNDHVQVGLRSRNDGPDVAEIAQYHGGGGHKHASGLSLGWTEFRRRVWDNYPHDAVVSAAATPGHPPGSASPRTASRTDSS